MSLLYVICIANQTFSFDYSGKEDMPPLGAISMYESISGPIGRALLCLGGQPNVSF